MCPATNIWTSGRFCPVKMYLQQFTKVFLWRLHCKHLTCPPLAALVSDNHCVITAHYGRPLGQAIIFCSCGFYFFFLSFFFFSSPILSSRRLVGCLPGDGQTSCKERCRILVQGAIQIISLWLPCLADADIIYIFVL